MTRLSTNLPLVGTRVEVGAIDVDMVADLVVVDILSLIAAITIGRPDGAGVTPSILTDSNRYLLGQGNNHQQSNCHQRQDTYSKLQLFLLL